MAVWRKIPLPECLVEHEIGRWNQIYTSEIQRTGRYPVIDQGQAYIAGYTDEESRVILRGLPYVIFGDHTRCFKYVDFPFVLGADGTKVLKPDPDLFDSKFFYFALLSLEIPNRGYNRHFTLLRQKMIPQPAPPEQRQIARLLSAVQRAIESQERLIALASELKNALICKLFTEGTRREALKRTELGPMPKSWKTMRVADVCKLVSGGTPSKSNATFWNGPIPWVSPKDMKKSRLSDAEDHISQAGLEGGSRLVPAGSIFVVIRGMILMRDVPVAQATVPMAFNQDMKALVEHKGVSADFLLYSLQRAREQLLRKVGSSAHGTRTLMTSAIEELLIGVPDLSEQKVISEALRFAEAKEGVYRQTADRLRELFRTLLHQLMTAQIRVHDLDLSALEDLGAESATGM